MTGLVVSPKQVADVDAPVRAIEADGGRTLMPCMHLPVGCIAMVADPMGAPFGVVGPKGNEGRA